MYSIGLIAHLILRLTIGDYINLLALVNLLTPYYFAPLILILPLVLVMRLRRVVLVAGILTLIGLAAYGPRFIPRTQVADAPTLSIVTWNVYRRNVETAEIIQWLHQQNADVVLLQELPRLEMEHILDGIETYYPYMRVREPSDGGIVTLSRLPILEAASFALSNANRVQQRIVLEVQGQPIVVYNVHLANPIPARQIPEYRREAPFLLHLIASYNDDQRDVEVEMLLGRIADEHLPFIVAGDFNMSDQSAQYPVVAAQMRDSFAEVGFGLGGTWPAKDTRGLPPIVPPLLRLDYIWHSADWMSLSAAAASAPGSDHVSVSATLALQQ